MSAAGIGYTAAGVSAVVFAVAAAVKLRDLAGTTSAFTELGVPRARQAALFVPLAELSIVALLLIVPTVGAIGALVTLAFFTTFLVGRLRSGVRTPCACFGSARRVPLSSVEVTRNLGLMVLAGAVLSTDRPVRPTLGDVLVVVLPVGVAAVGLHLAGRRVRSRLDAGTTR